ncbi:hypothetical protein [Photobacterium toruni]|uniref:hypothetical protein n=1 Tax=Photobacterium toruni TaxID=1935446 RepID=UPI00210F49DC|nr:hypothetical protein [Photobacterium toruni]
MSHDIEYIICPNCNANAVTGNDIDYDDFNFDFCPSCFLLATEGYDYDSTMERIYRIKVICGLINCKNVSELRQHLDTLDRSTFVCKSLFDNRLDLKHPAFRKLGGDAIYHTLPKYKKNYTSTRPSSQSSQSLTDQIQAPDDMDWDAPF